MPDVNKTFCVCLRGRLAKAGNATDKKWMEKYMRGQYTCFGVKTEKRRVCMRSAIEQSPGLNFNANAKIKAHRKTSSTTSANATLAHRVFSLCKALFACAERECHLCAIDVLCVNVPAFASAVAGLASESRSKRIKRLNDWVNCILDSFVRKHGWWDTVDFVATKFLGMLLRPGGSHFSPSKEERAAIAHRLIADENKWVRRCALLFQLHYGKETDQPLLFELIRKVKAEDEFFIQKAIGWALRQMSRHNPKAVRAYVEEHSDFLSTLAQREALRLLPKLKSTSSASSGKRLREEVKGTGNISGAKRKRQA